MLEVKVGGTWCIVDASCTTPSSPVKVSGYVEHLSMQERLEHGARFSQLPPALGQGLSQRLKLRALPALVPARVAR